MNYDASEMMNEALGQSPRGLRRQRRRFGLGRRLGRTRVAEYDDAFLFQWPASAVPPVKVSPGSVRPEVSEFGDRETQDFFQYHLGDEGERTPRLWSIRRVRVEALEANLGGIGVFQKVNNSRWINKYFRAVNARLEAGGTFVGCAEVNGQRMRRFYRKYSAPVARLRYGLDFLVHRVWPKVPGIKKLYFSITRGHNRPLSLAELLGRLVSCGFEIIEHREIRGLTWFAARKVCDADVVRGPSYGPFCRLLRIGRHGEFFFVYKFRTMHPYAEFLQEYIYRTNNLQSGGKFSDDFRITSWGRWLRRLWLDELPMLLNLLKREMKPVGVRPLSAQYFSLYPPELQELRKRHTPGLLPPYYADMPKTFDEIVASELRYLQAFEKAPIRTDLKYAVAAVWNILARKARSG